MAVQQQFATFKRLPDLPSASSTPRTKISKITSRSSTSSYPSQLTSLDIGSTGSSTHNNDGQFRTRFVRKASCRRESYCPIDDEDLDEEDEETDDDLEEEDEHILTSNITHIAAATTTDHSSRLKKIFRRKRGVPTPDDDDGYKRHNPDPTDLSLKTATSKPTTCVSSTYAHYSMRDELNLQKIIINTIEMHASAALPQSLCTEHSEGETQTQTHLHDEMESTRDDTQCGEHMMNHEQSKQLDTTHGFEFYVNLRNMVSILTLIAIGTMQFVYYRYYYLCGVFTSITAMFYMLLFVPRISHSLSEECLCAFALIVIRLFHIMSLLTIFVGVETCLFHYERVVHSTQDNGDLDVWIGLLWTCIIAAIVMCILQNVYVIKYDEFVVVKWKLVYCCKGQYYINNDGSWRADLHPISGCDGLLTTGVFITTFAAVISGVVSIHKMEMIMKRYGV
eukprot:5294_1